MFIALQKYLKVGKVYKNRNNVVFVVKFIEEIFSVIIPLFDNTNLKSEKLNSYLIFKKVVLLIKDKKYLKLENLLQIIDLAYFMNKSSSRTIEKKEILLNKLKLKYGKLPVFLPIEFNFSKLISEIKTTEEFVIGQIDGDGSFNIALLNNQKKIKVNFTVVDEISSISVLNDLIYFF